MKNKKFPIYYETFGDPNHPSIILIHGIGAQLIQWSSILIEGLVSSGFHVVIFDNRDSGLSQYYDDLGSPDVMAAIFAKNEGKKVEPLYTLEDMASDLKMLMDQLSIQKAHILGTSMGGMIAQLFALQYPERVLSLTLIATSSGDPNLPPATPAVMQFFFTAAESPEKETLKSFIETKINLYRIYDPHFFNEDQARQLHVELYQRAYHPAGFKRQLLAVLGAEPRGEKLKQLHLKSLIIHGANDPAFPVRHGEYLAKCLPESRLEIIEKMGHVLSDEVCNKVVSLVSELK